MNLSKLLVFLIFYLIKSSYSSPETTTAAVPTTEKVKSEVPGASTIPSETTKLVEKPTTSAPSKEESSNSPKLSCYKETSDLICTVKEFKFTSKETLDLPNSEDLKQFSEAKVLNFESTSIPEIPVELAKIFPEIETLNVTGVDLKQINRDVMKTFTKLKVFDASNNKLKLIVKDVFDGNPDLTEIILKNNEIEAVVTRSLRSLSKLKVLDLKKNKCIDERFENLDGNDRERQKQMNVVMVKCKTDKKEKSSSLLEIIPKTLDSFASFG